MKQLRFTSIFILLFLSLTCYAQEIKIKSFSLMMDPMTVPMQRKDLNGDICALVKVILPSDQAVFEGNLVGDWEYKTCEYWCYMTPGSKLLKIKYPGYEPLMVNFSVYMGKGLESKRIYELILSVGTGISAPETHTYRTSSPAPQPSETPISSKSSTTQQSSTTVSSGGGEVESFTVNGVTFEMVRVEGGSFMMGSEDGANDEKPVHRENVSTFYIGKTEVTQALWKAVMGDDPSAFKGANRPVESVSWDDCQEFVDRLSRLTGKRFRLPTEAEWEYAARGGNRSRGYTYSGSDNIDRVGWYGDNSGEATHPVAQKLDNELGLYDMTGNVWEWTSDKYSGNYNTPRNSSYRVIRGGGWNKYASDCRVSCRFNTSLRYNNLGLRLAF